jgi:hypothetical protein
MASFLEGQKTPRRTRVRFTAPRSSAAKRLSLFAKKKSPRRTRVTVKARRVTTAGNC